MEHLKIDLPRKKKIVRNIELFRISEKGEPVQY